MGELLKASLLAAALVFSPPVLWAWDGAKVADSQKSCLWTSGSTQELVRNSESQVSFQTPVAEIMG